MVCVCGTWSGMSGTVDTLWACCGFHIAAHQYECQNWGTLEERRVEQCDIAESGSRWWREQRLVMEAGGRRYAGILLAGIWYLYRDSDFTRPDLYTIITYLIMSWLGIGLVLLIHLSKVWQFQNAELDIYSWVDTNISFSDAIINGHKNKLSTIKILQIKI